MVSAIMPSNNSLAPAVAPFTAPAVVAAVVGSTVAPAPAPIFSASDKVRRVEKHKAAIKIAMKNKDFSNFMHHLIRIPRSELDKAGVSDFLVKNRERFAELFIRKRTIDPSVPKAPHDRLDKKEWDLRHIKRICNVDRCVVDEKPMFRLNDENIEDITVYEIHRNPGKPSEKNAFGFLRMDKLHEENTYIVRYMATSEVARGKCLAYQILNFAIKDVLKMDPDAEVKLEDDSKGVATRLYQEVGQARREIADPAAVEEFQTREQQERTPYGIPVTWFTYSSNP